MASGEIEAVKSRGQSRAKLVVGEWVRMYAEKDVGDGRPVRLGDGMAGAWIKG